MLEFLIFTFFIEFLTKTLKKWHTIVEWGIIRYELHFYDINTLNFLYVFVKIYREIIFLIFTASKENLFSI